MRPLTTIPGIFCTDMALTVTPPAAKISAEDASAALDLARARTRPLWPLARLMGVRVADALEELREILKGKDTAAGEYEQSR